MSEKFSKKLSKKNNQTQKELKIKKSKSKELFFDLSSTKEYLRLLDPSTNIFSFYCFHPRKKLPPRIYEHTDFDSIADLLCRDNALGFGIFIGMNVLASDKSRASKHIIRVRSVWQDDDNGWKGKLPLTPSIVVRTSLGKLQRIWTIKGNDGDLSQFSSVMKRMIESYGADKNCADLARVLRVPGFWHTKKSDVGDWKLVTLDQSGKTGGTGKRYSWKKIAKKFKANGFFGGGGGEIYRKGEVEDPALRIAKITDAKAYYQEMLGQGMRVMNKGLSREEGIAHLRGLLELGRAARPDQNMDIWLQREEMIPTFIDSALDKIKTEGGLGGIGGIGGGLGFGFGRFDISPPGTYSGATMSLGNLLDMDIGDMEYFLSPNYLQNPSITMIHAARGLGKTFFAASMALALSIGAGFLKWNPTNTKGVKVLYADGEMPLKAIQNHFKTIKGYFICRGSKCSCWSDCAATKGKVWVPGIIGACGALKVSEKKFNERVVNNFKLVTIDKFPDMIFPDLTPRAEQRVFEADLIVPFNPDIILLDNLTTIFKTAEDDQKSWKPVQSWLASLRSSGKSVVVIHHDNKEGSGQRGFSNKEDIIDYSIHLKKPAGHKPSDGARMMVNFTKTRDLHGEAVVTFEARLMADSVDIWGVGANGVSPSVWEWSQESMTTVNAVAALIKEGAVSSQKELAEELEVKQPAISKAIKRAVNMGLITHEEANGISKRRSPLVAKGF